MSRLRTDYVLVDLELRPGVELVDALAIIAHGGHTIQGLTSEVREEGASFQLEVRVPPDRQLEPVIAELSRMDGVEAVRATGLNGR
jgi:hypothetical protein